MELAAFVIALVALIMTMPYILQLIFGQPKLGIAFDHDDSDDQGRIIRIRIMNKPVSNRLLTTLKVARLPAQGLHLIIQVFDASTRKAITKSFVGEMGLSPSDRTIRVTLPPSIVPINARLARWQRSTNSAILFADRDIPLPEGKYIVGIRIELAGTVKVAAEPILHVGKCQGDMKWDDATSNKVFSV
jgi:hypothetical protein